MSLRVVIVDDEPLARERVRIFLTEEPDVEIIAECGDGADAVSKIEKLRPDVLFLDVQMPRLNGFEVLEALDASAMPAVIFTTAHDDHAIRAFEVSAVDYLLKPFKQPRFRKALERARTQRRAPAAGKADPQLSTLLAQWREGAGGGPRVLVKSPDRILFLKPGEIDHIEACGNYVVLHVGKEKHIVRETMTAMEARLGNSGFMRINRSVILNLGRIKELQPAATGEYVVILKTGVRLTFLEPLAETAAETGRWSASRWNYRWTSGYGSPHFSVENPKKQGEDGVEIKAVKLSDDRKTVTLLIDDMKPVMQMKIGYTVSAADGAPVKGAVYHTIHALGGE